jgi:hypothetical protein
MTRTSDALPSQQRSLLLLRSASAARWGKEVRASAELQQLTRLQRYPVDVHPWKNIVENGAGALVEAEPDESVALVIRYCRVRGRKQAQLTDPAAAWSSALYQLD